MIEELERLRKEALVASSELYPGIFLERLRTSIRIADIQAEI
jgi:hypothetical protein